MHGTDEQEEEGEQGWVSIKFSNVGFVHFLQFSLFVAQIFQLSLDMQVQLCPASHSDLVHRYRVPCPVCPLQILLCRTAIIIITCSP